MLAWAYSVPHECYLSCLLNKHHFKPHLNPLSLCERLSACIWGQLRGQQLEWDQEPWDPRVSGAAIGVSVGVRVSLWSPVKLELDQPGSR